MDFAKSLMVLLRRWYVALPALMISLGLAAMVFEAVPPKYSSTGTIVLLTPNTGASGGISDKSPPTNPLLSFDGSLIVVSTALTSVLMSPEVVQDLYNRGATADYEVGDGKLPGPFINVVATGRSPTETRRTVTMVLQRAAVELRTREIAFNAPDGSFIQINDLVRPTEATKLNGSKIRAAGAAMALALAFTISSAFMIESIAENRRARRRRRAIAPTTGPAHAPPGTHPGHPAHATYAGQAGPYGGQGAPHPLAGPPQPPQPAPVGGGWEQGTSLGHGPVLEPSADPRRPPSGLDGSETIPISDIGRIRTKG